jgi:tRNA 2-(methylsulfanyl)-N6-isopentenyladenosine37 hydroxylase
MHTTTEPTSRISAGFDVAIEDALRDILPMLPCRTPAAWLDHAETNVDLLLIDHANCEKKAASAALNLMYRYVDKPTLLSRMSRLAREELRHFEQVLTLMRTLGVQYRHLTPGRYAAAMHRQVRNGEPGRLIDLLLVGAIVEARSCERFHALSERLAAPLDAFYRRLLLSEAGHFRRYLALARHYADAAGIVRPVTARLDELLSCERTLVLGPDEDFRFHSGPPAITVRQPGD